jgi:hypothetical protein
MRAIGLDLFAASDIYEGLVVDQGELELTAVAGLVARQRLMLQAV